MTARKCLLRSCWLVLLNGTFVLVPMHESISQDVPNPPASPPAEETPARRNLGVDETKQVERLVKEVNESERAGKFAEAQRSAREILEIRTRVHGADHWQTTDAARCVRTLEQIVASSPEVRAEIASSRRLQGEGEESMQRAQYPDAEMLFRKALAISEKVLGPDHPYTIQSSTYLAATLYAQGRYVEAEALLQDLLKVCRRVFGEVHPETAGIYSNLAFNESAQGRHAASEPLFRKALRIEGEVLGADDPTTATSYNNLADNLNVQGRYAEAEPLYRSALKLREILLGAGHIDTAAFYRDLAVNLNAQGRYAEAEPLFRKALMTSEKVLGVDHLSTAIVVDESAVNHYAQGRYADAEPLYRRVMEVREKALGAEHPDTVRSSNRLAANLNQLGRYAEAEALLRKALAIRERVLPKDHLDTAESYNNLAANLSDRGRYAEAEPLFRKALMICEKVLGVDHLSTAIVVDESAVNLYAQGRYADAEPLYRRVMEVREKALGAEHPDTVRSSNRLAANLNQLARYAEAEALLRKALAIRERVLPKDHLDTAESYNNLAANLADRGRYAAAEPLLRKALAIFKGVPDPDLSIIVIGYNNLGGILDKQNKHTEAESLSREAMAICEKELGPSHPLTATTYTNLAEMIDDKGKNAEAESLYRKALVIRSKALGERHPDTASSYNSLAGNLHDQGRFAAAEPLLRKALAIHRTDFTEDHLRTADLYNNLAVNLSAQGKHTEAEPLFRGALAIREKVLVEDDPYMAQSCNNLGNSLHAQGRYAEAESLIRRGVAVCEKSLPADHPDLAENYNSLAYGLNAQGRYDEAEPLFRKALAINRKLHGQDHHDTALGLNNLAYNLSDQGKYAEAEPLYRQAATIWKRVLGQDHPDTAACWNIQAYNLHAQGKYAEAEAVWTEAARSFEVARRPISHTGLERAAFGVERSPFPPLAIMFARRGAAAPAWRHLEADLARGLFDDLARPLEPDERRREQDLLARLQRLEEGVAVMSATPGGDAALLKQAADSRAQRDAMKVEWAEFQAGVERKYGAAAGRPYDLGRIQGQIPPDAALVAWLDIGALPHAADPEGEHWACLVRRRGEPIWVKLPGSGPQGQWIHDDNHLPTRVMEAFARRPPDSTAAWRGLAGRLAAQRLAPLGPHLGAGGGLPAARHLIVLPSLWMAGVPVEALVEVQPPDAPRYTVSYAPSGTMFAWLRERQPSGRGLRAESPHLLILGDPTPDPPRSPSPMPPDDRIELSRGPELPRLKWAPQEIKAVAALFAEPLILVRSDASEQKLDELIAADGLRRFGVLHLATHGRMDPRAAMQSRLSLARDRLPDAADRVVDGREPHDGVLTAEQVLRTWHLDADLVTLSACQTALGQPGGGEGYLGFAQALFLAGSQSLILSLWAVDDEATALMMVRFYQNWLGKRPGLDRPLSKAEALREAKDWLQGLTAEEVADETRRLTRGEMEGPGLDRAPVARRFDHPFYWAGFILIGDPN